MAQQWQRGGDQEAEDSHILLLGKEEPGCSSPCTIFLWNQFRVTLIFLNLILPLILGAPSLRHKLFGLDCLGCKQKRSPFRPFSLLMEEEPAWEANFQEEGVAKNESWG